MGPWEIVQLVVIVAYMGGLDRLRGDAFDLLDRRVWDRLAYGWLVAALFGHPWDAHTAAIIAAMYAGMAPGWGGAIGPALRGYRPTEAELERWQIGPLATNAWLALIARGVLWGAMFIPLALWLHPTYWFGVAAYTTAMPTAVLLARRAGTDWEKQEHYRGWIAGTLIAAGMVTASL